MGPTTLSAAWAGAAAAASPRTAAPSAVSLVNFVRRSGRGDSTVGLLSMDRSRSCRERDHREKWGNCDVDDQMPRPGLWACLRRPRTTLAVRAIVTDRREGFMRAPCFLDENPGSGVCWVT